jgi:hypothetical protein
MGPTGGEPLWIVLKDPLIFFPTRRRPNTVLNRRLPRITARDVFLKVPFGDCSYGQRADGLITR